MDMTTLQIDDLQFEVRRSARRRSLEITVDRGGELILSVPTDCPDERLQDFVRRKRMWIYQQLARKEATSAAVRPKEFVDGATHRKYYWKGNYPQRKTKNESGIPSSSAGVSKPEDLLPGFRENVFSITAKVRVKP